MANEILTAEQIAERTKDTNGVANIKAINALYRAQDESALYPINGRYNVTTRAINRVRKLARSNGGLYGLEYCYALEYEMQLLVNYEVHA